MPVIAVVGGHWGDEGKGKVVDFLSQEADMVIRYNGGNNAGHTVVNEYGTFRLHLVPGGIFNPKADCLIGPGAVVNPDALLKEIGELEAHGISVDRLYISDRAHIVLPHHVLIDVLEERARGPRPHGTTKQGIWPVYADKAARIGLRMGDLLEEGYLEEHLNWIVARKGAHLQGVYGYLPLEYDEVMAKCRQWRERLASRIVDTLPMVQRALREDRYILLEGHLGVMRDLDWGIYPYVTSSTTLPGGACAGAGIPPQAITRVVGVVKAYTTAVGAGPLPTEISGELADQLRERGQEYGATTGRPRRCGWFDGVAARYAAQVAGFTDLAVMKLDVLDGMERVKICVGYRLGDRVLETVPHTAVLERVQPVYEELPGWRGPCKGIRAYSQLPPEAKRYLKRIEEIVGVPISLIGVGPGREEMIEIPSLSPVGGGRR